MDWLGDINWFAIHTKRFRESLAAGSVGALGVEVFLPMVKVDCPGHAVIHAESKPLFPAYFFARFSPALFREPVESARGVLHVVKSGSCPVPVEEQAIREIQDRVGDDGLIRLKRQEFRPGDRVCIQQGPFAGMLARVEEELDDGQRVAILLQALWNARVLIERRCVMADAS